MSSQHHLCFPHENSGLACGGGSACPVNFFRSQKYRALRQIARTKAANKDIPDVHQNRLLQPEVLSGTRVKLITAAMR